MVPARTAIVTGGAQGIGKATVRELLRRGFNTVIADRDEQAGRETLNEYTHLGPLILNTCDVSDEAAVQYLVKETIDKFSRIDVLVNNAAESCRKPIDTLTLAEWNRIIATNLTGSFLCAKYTAAHLRRHKGVILNIASTRALMSEADTEAYSASKGGILALTHALAVSLGPHIRVNCISPGWIEVGEWQRAAARRQPQHTPRDRDQHPAGRVGTPEDIASMICFLASEHAGFITGAHFVVDGGMTRKMIYAG